ncbi:MAG: hypothetical protein ACTHMI_03570 [Mucilaginibacter sp.]
METRDVIVLKKLQLTLFPRSEERVAGRSDGGVSPGGGQAAVMHN